MSRIIANNIRHNDATVDSITLDSAGNVSVPNDLAVDTDTLFVDVSADRVGINTTSPRNALHALSSNGDIRIDTSTNGGAAGLIFDVPASNGLRASGHRAKIQCEHTGSGWDSNLIFYGGNTSTEPSEQLRITSDNYLRMASGTGGIQFNGNTAAANALDDYEEGTFDPTVTMHISGSFTLQSSFNSLSYTKIGSTVLISGQIRIDTVSSPSGNIKITNLPFAVRSTAELARAGNAIFYFDNSAGSGNYFKAVPANVTESTTTLEILTYHYAGGLVPGPADELGFSIMYVAA